MRRPARTRPSTSRLIIAAVLLGLCGPLPAMTVLGQDLDCASLKARIDAARDQRSPDAGGALRQQQFELDRLRNYADSIGCGSGFFFGAPPQCDSVEARIQRLQDRVDQSRQEAPDGDEGGWTRRAMIEQYNATCRGDPDGDTGANGRLLPADPDATGPDASQSDDGQGGAPVHSKAICVRHCDGGFFPITEQATSGSLEHLGQICKALCPNAEASIYTLDPQAGLDAAVAPDGSSYTALPAAFRFEKTYDPTCSCKPAGQSWAQALADAETLLERDKSDVVVTKQMSDAMSRPVQAARPDATPKPARTGKAARNPKPASTVAGRTPARTSSAPRVVDQGSPAPPADSVPDALTRQFRRSEPTF